MELAQGDGALTAYAAAAPLEREKVELRTATLTPPTLLEIYVSDLVIRIVTAYAAHNPNLVAELPRSTDSVRSAAQRSSQHNIH